MTVSKTKVDDKRIEQIIALLLRSGVLLAAAVVLFGGLLYLLNHHATTPQYRVFHSADTPFRNLRNILHSAWLGNSEAIIQTGILLLIATPVARVIFSVVAFALERDRMYVIFSFGVLVILIFSLFHGGTL
jgi:uncharacterized membrane protein